MEPLTSRRTDGPAEENYADTCASHALEKGSSGVTAGPGVKGPGSALDPSR